MPAPFRLDMQVIRWVVSTLAPSWVVCDGGALRHGGECVGGVRITPEGFYCLHHYRALVPCHICGEGASGETWVDGYRVCNDCALAEPGPDYLAAERAHHLSGFSLILEAEREAIGGWFDSDPLKEKMRMFEKSLTRQKKQSKT